MHNSPSSPSKYRTTLLLIAALTIFIFIFRITNPIGLNHGEEEESHHQPKTTPTKHKIEEEETTNEITTIPKGGRGRKNQEQSSLLNGVIMYLYGGRWNDYFVNNALPRLDEYFLSCYPYPVLVFHEGASQNEKQAIIRALPKGQEAFDTRRKINNNNENSNSRTIVSFDDVTSVWKSLPSQVSNEKLQKWLQDPVQKKFQGRGYRIMCRFWHGLVWLRSSLDKYEYYWRLDTDSILTKPVLLDPFVLVFYQQKCVYGFNRLKGENPHVATGLFDTFKKFLKSEVESGYLNQEQEDECIRFVTLRSDGIFQNPNKPSWWAPMYYNNFEMGTMQLKRSGPYQRFFNWVDEKEPFGTFRYRWGDAPLHTLGILVAQKCSVQTFCNVTFSQVPYRHAVTRMPPMLRRSDKCGEN